MTIREEFDSENRVRLTDREYLKVLKLMRPQLLSSWFILRDDLTLLHLTLNKFHETEEIEAELFRLEMEKL